ncbi:hypothetical protein J4410_07180 [Candidatus Woesearchaeota archaeon]|nr:hypothetical protein [Candidatus Woesearchaeota archaeon]
MIPQCNRCKKEIAIWESKHVGKKHYHTHTCSCGYITSRHAETEGSMLSNKWNGIEKKVIEVGMIKPAKPKFEHIGEPKPVKK